MRGWFPSFALCRTNPEYPDRNTQTITFQAGWQAYIYIFQIDQWEKRTVTSFEVRLSHQLNGAFSLRFNASACVVKVVNSVFLTYFPLQWSSGSAKLLGHCLPSFCQSWRVTISVVLARLQCKPYPLNDSRVRGKIAKYWGVTCQGKRGDGEKKWT